MEFEKYRDIAYKPTPDDVWTIAWGHTKGVKEYDTCYPTQGYVWLHEDVHAAEDAVNAFVHPILTQNQFDALVSFTFNNGARALETSALLAKLNDGDFKGAAAQFDRWVHQNGKVLGGLVRRRAEEKRLFETP
jgi:lysozyme